jgi:glycosyltransferase involved in cell wall biosynthesis
MEKPLITIGMASYRNHAEVWFTIQALKLYHDLTDCEILVVDNYGDSTLEDWINYWNRGLVRYIKYTEKHGTAPAKQAVFDNAQGDFVLCMDSHIMLIPGSIDKLKEFIRLNPGYPNLIQGPMLYDDLDLCIDHMDPVWRTHMYGIWGEGMSKTKLPIEPYEIPMMGMGVFGCFKDKWLGFNREFVGFGGEEGYIHEKYRKYGFKVMCFPWLRWCHKFHDQTSQTYYPNILEERVMNYLIGFTELGLDIQQIIDHFGEGIVKRSGWKKE